MKNGFSAIGMVLTLALITGVIAYFISERSSLSVQAQKSSLDELKIDDFIEFSTMYLRSKDNCLKEIRLSNNGTISFTKTGMLSQQIKALNITLKSIRKSFQVLPGGTFNTLVLDLKSNKRPFKRSLYLYLVSSGNNLLGCKATALDRKTKLPLEQRVCNLVKNSSFNPATGLCE